ncbi:sigma-70 family RNA polymerase sigma factor [Kerstersia sp.]|uniref:sigma-70 family RNA polymerase sigma factor n=1 Tax=Kerstersia sp. TaxID=1930783 RepID=UPI003F9009A8
MSRQAPADHSTIEYLYRSHYGELLRWLARKLGNSSQATDLAQDTFLRMLSRHQAQPLEGQALKEPRAYLKTIANGLVVDFWRRQTLERAYLDALAQQPEPLALSPEEHAVILETLQQLSRLIEAMKPKVRSAFLMAQLDGMSYAEIASQMGISVRTVERYMADALFHCHRLMQADPAAD